MSIVLLATLTILLFLRYQSEYERREDFTRYALAQTRLVAEYVVSPMVFDDASGARDILAKLANHPHVTYIRLYDARRRLFSEVLIGTGNVTSPAIAAGQDHVVIGKVLHIAEPVRQQGIIGELRVGYRVDRLESASGREMKFLLAVLAAVIAASYLLSL